MDCGTSSSASSSPTCDFSQVALPGGASPGAVQYVFQPEGAAHCAPGGFSDEEVAEKLVNYLFAVRNAMDPAEAYRQFRGRDATIDALLRDRGFVPAPSE